MMSLSRGVIACVVWSCVVLHVMSFNFYESPDFEEDVQSLVSTSPFSTSSSSPSSSSPHSSPALLERVSHARGDHLRYRERIQARAMNRLRMRSGRRPPPAAPAAAPTFQLLETRNMAEAASRAEQDPFGGPVNSNDGQDVSSSFPVSIHQTSDSEGRFDAPAFAEVMDQLQEISTVPDRAIADHHKSIFTHHVVSKPHRSPPMSPPPPPADEMAPPTLLNLNQHTRSLPDMADSTLLETKAQVQTKQHAQAQTKSQTQSQVKAMSVAAIQSLLKEQARRLEQKQHSNSRRTIIAPPVALHSDRSLANAPWRKY